MNHVLQEGGNVFKDDQGRALTQPIQQSDVAGTVRWLQALLKLDLSGDLDPATGYPSRWLGSTGKKPQSGDLDLAVDANEISKEQLTAKLMQWAQKQGQDPRLWVKKAGEVHLRTPINGDPDQGYVQTDFMFFSDLDWGQFYYGGGVDSAYKGQLRNVLMSSIARTLGLKVGANGLFSRASNQLVDGGQDPDHVASVLLGPGHSRRSLRNVESIYQALYRDRQQDIKLADFRQYLAQQGLLEPGAVREETETNFLARLRDRIVNQGYVSLIEHSRIEITEDRDPRIPYVEDLVIDRGLAGAQQAIDILRQTAKNTKDYATIKWDGSPAVIFGRKPDTGEFVLTDKSGATAVGYDGLATSSDMMSRILRQRDTRNQGRDRGELIEIYNSIWPYLEAAVRPNFRGYIKGDLLFSPSRPWREENGHVVFQPNQLGGKQYRIPIDSELGQQIFNSAVGVVIHTQMADPHGQEQSMPNPQKVLAPVPGLLATSATVKNLQNVRLDPDQMRELRQFTVGAPAAALQQMLNPAELRAQQITDLPALMKKFINSLKGTDFSKATPADFGKWLRDPANGVSARKYQNIVEYLTNPASNVLGMQTAFDIWNMLHSVKTQVQRQLDLQQPGHEGWVLATPAGRAKLVSRVSGGYADPQRKLQANQ